jgi:hypothetical protein
MTIKRRLLVPVLAVTAVATAGLGACSPGNNFRDVKGVKSQDPDLIESYNNLDGHPNIAKVCIDGVAFATTTRDAQAAIQRVPDWDATCPAAKPK